MSKQTVQRHIGTNGLCIFSTKGDQFNDRRYVLWLATVFGVLILALRIALIHRHDWILENVLILPALAVVVAIYHFMPLSRLSWMLVFAFLCLHELRAHFTYSAVPQNAWL